VLYILFVYLTVIGTMLHCFILRVSFDTLHNGLSPVPVSTESETYSFLVIIIIIKIWHGTFDTLKDYLTVTKHFLTSSYNKTTVCDTFLNILGYVHFSYNYTATDTTVTQNLTDDGNWDILLTCWVMFIQNCTVFQGIWLWAKLQYFSKEE
jgi:hypothetical protein